MYICCTGRKDEVGTGLRPADGDFHGSVPHGEQHLYIFMWVEASPPNQWRI